MEVGGCVWMRRAVAGAQSMFRMKPSTVSSSFKTTCTIRRRHYRSNFYPSYITRLSILSQTRRPLSTATCLPQNPLATIDCCSDAGDGDDDINVLSNMGSRVLLKGLSYNELERWVGSHGFRPGQALMLWKRLYGDNIWARCTDELEGLNKDFKKMLGEHAEFRALSLKDILTASDGTRKEVSDFIYTG